MTAIDKALLLQEIAQAWADAVYPGDDNIFTAHSYDDEGITEYFSGTTWKGHPAVDLRAHSAAVSIFFAPAAYCYWLAAYLIAAIEDPYELSQGLDSMLSSLSPDSSLARSGEQDARLSLLTKKQLSATIRTVEYLGHLFEPTEGPAFATHQKEILSFLHKIYSRAKS